MNSRLILLIFFLPLLIFVNACSSTTSSPEPSDGGESENANYSVEGSGNYEVPGKYRSEPLRFTSTGTNYLIEYYFTATYEQEQAVAAYLSLHMGCTNEKSETVLSASATQNIKGSEENYIKIGDLIESSDRGENITCTATIASPEEGKAAQGATIEINDSLNAHTVEHLHTLSSVSELPRVLDPDESIELHKFSADRATTSNDMYLIGRYRLTTCTMNNGSKDEAEGKAMCKGSIQDKEGNTFAVIITPSNPSNTKCSFEEQTVLEHHIDYDEHHYLADINYSIPNEQECNFSVEIKNEGPAAMLIHSNTGKFYVAS